MNENNHIRLLGLPLKDVPDGLKIKVMKDIATAKILMELERMFALNVGTVIERTVAYRKLKNCI